MWGFLFNKINMLRPGESLEIWFAERIFVQDKNMLLLFGRKGSGKTYSIKAIRREMYPHGILQSGDIKHNAGSDVAVTDVLLDVEKGTILVAAINID